MLIIHHACSFTVSASRHLEKVHGSTDTNLTLISMHSEFTGKCRRQANIKIYYPQLDLRTWRKSHWASHNNRNPTNTLSLGLQLQWPPWLKVRFAAASGKRQEKLTYAAPPTIQLNNCFDALMDKDYWAVTNSFDTSSIVLYLFSYAI